MKIVLLSPPTSPEQLYGSWDLSSVDTYCPPLGLLYIASYSRETNHQVQVFDIAALKWNLEKIIDEVISFSPDLVGLTSMTINVLNANKIAEGLKARGFKAPIVLGGPHFTAAPIETLEKFTSIDFGVIGEGEITFLELVEQLGTEKRFRSLEGLAWRDSSGNVVINAPRALIQDLDMLPLPAWDLLTNFPGAYPHNVLEVKRLPAASVMTSRGCPFQCTFCDHRVFGSRVRYHSPEYTLDMIKLLRNDYGIRDLMFLDDNLLLNKKHLFSLCDALRNNFPDLNWYCLAHANQMSQDNLEKIKEAGCWIMEVGIESGNDDILKLLKRNSSKAIIIDAIKRAKKIGIKVKGNFIFGLPNETKETLAETIEFATTLDISLFQQTFLTIWPGCELSGTADKYGKAVKDWSRLGHFRISFLPHGLSEEDLLNASKIAFRKFYLRPRIIFEILKSIRSRMALKFVYIGFQTFLKTMFRKNR